MSAHGVLVHIRQFPKKKNNNKKQLLLKKKEKLSQCE